MTGSISYFRKHEIYIKKQFIYKSSQNHNMLMFFYKKERKLQDYISEQTQQESSLGEKEHHLRTICCT